MKAVLAVVLSRIGEQEVSFPLYSTILSLKDNDGEAVLFYHCDPDEQRMSKRTVYACTTGNEAPALNGIDYLGTIVKDGTYHVHFFISK